MENQNEFMTKKKGNGTTIIIILLLVIILGLICYICYNQDIIFSDKEVVHSETSEKTDNDNTQNPSEEGRVTFSDSELEKYVNYISPFSVGPSALIYNVNHVSAQNLSASEKIEYIGSHVLSKQTSTPDYQYNIVAENDVKTAVEETYGPNSYERTTFNLGISDYVFNESDNNYYATTGAGGTTTTFVSDAIIDYKATKNKLEITTAYVFVDGRTNKFYKDYNQRMILDDYNGTGNPDDTYVKEYITNNKDKLYHIVYTFESTDGVNYYFKEFTNNI